MAGKTQRHAAIMEIIGGVDVASQEQLRSLLAERGVKVTQATLSRDLHELGVAPRPVPFPDLTAKALGDAITACLSEPAHRRRAAGLARGIAAEDGAAPLLAHIGSRSAG